MTSPAESLTQRITKRSSENELVNIREARGRIISQEADFVKWMVASLLALNGSGALAVWSSEKVPVGFSVAAINLQDWERYWISVSETLVHDDNHREKLDAEFTTAFAKTGMTPKVGISSPIAFLLGCGVAAVGVRGGSNYR